MKLQFRSTPQKSSLFGLSAVSALTLLATPVALAQTPIYWNSASTQNWNGAFWAPNADGTGTLTSPANDLTTNTAVFNASTQSGFQTIQLSGNTSIYGIVQNQTGTTQIRTNGSNRTLNIGAGGITLDSGAGTINFSQNTGAGNQVNIVLGSSQSWTNNSSTALTINDLGSIILGANTLTIAGSGSGQFNFGGISISGNGGSIVKNGTNNLNLGTNSFTGGITLNAGTLTLGSGTALGGAASVFTITGGTVAIGATTRNTLNNNAMNWNGDFTVTGSGQTWNTGTGAVTLGANCTVTLGTVPAATPVLNVTGVISGSGFGINKAGDGTLTLSTANTYTGNTTVSAGTLNLAATGQLTFITGNVDNGGNNAITGAGTVVLDGTFAIDTTATDASALTTGSWVIENVDTLTGPYGESFSVVGWNELVANEWSKTEGTKRYTFYEATGTVTLTVATDPYSIWISGFTFEPGADLTPTGDPDNDGNSNLIEFATHGIPNDGSNNGLKASVIQDSSAPAGNDLALVVAVRDGAVFSDGASGTQTATVDGITYTIEGSLDLVFPASNVSVAGAASDIAPASTGLPSLVGTAWEYRTFKLDSSEGLAGKGFLRLKVTQP